MTFLRKKILIITAAVSGVILLSCTQITAAANNNKAAIQHHTLTNQQPVSTNTKSGTGKTDNASEKTSSTSHVNPDSTDQYRHFLTNFGSIILAVLAAGIILLLAKRKTPRGFSFKVRTSLNSIIGYSKLFYNGKLGPVSTEQKELIDHILAATLVVAVEIDKIETLRLTKPDRRMSFVLRTSLMDINGYCDLLYRSKPNITQNQKECLEEIHQGSKLILQILSDNT